jgi:probable phosphoglycerate mutase
MTADEIKTSTRAPTQTLPSLRERNFGDLRGRSYDELDDEPFAADYHPRNGESWPQFHERVTIAWREIKAVAEHADGDIVVVTHALVCHSLLERHVDPGSCIPAGARIQNTSLSIIDGGPPWVLERLACTLHLQA